MKTTRPILEVANSIGIKPEFLELYGNDKAKIDVKCIENLQKKNGDIVLVTAITPTKAGEGKTTMSIALADGLNAIGEQAILCLREPSVGPVFGIKGGATGGGKAQVVPSEEINLHFTGDMHALTSSINLISAIIDNHIYRGNELKIDPEKVVWRRALDMNDRALRDVTVSDDGKGFKRKDHFQITVASELMAILCLSDNEEDFLRRIKRILVAYTIEDKPVFLSELKISHAIMKLMRKALKPNLVQTLEGNPCLIHGGPFANIAHGCNSLIATKLATKLAPIVVTEAGFAADLGAEKFFDIKARIGNLKPKLAVLVATIRALKLHGGANDQELNKSDVAKMIEGTKNLEQHLVNLQKYNLPVLIAINHFQNDSEEEVKALIDWCNARRYQVTFVDSFLNGSQGANDFAIKVRQMLKTYASSFRPLYPLEMSIKDKIKTIAKEIYRAKDVKFSSKALKGIKLIETLGFQNIPVCIAKTPHSFSDDPTLLNVPKDFTLHVREVYISAGAGFAVCLTGELLTMPGLPKIPSAVKMEESDY